MVDPAGDRSDDLGDVSSEEIRAAAVHCEALKLSLSHTKDGVKVVFLIQPQDMPARLYTDPIGARYLLALVKLGDDERPEPSPEVIEGRKAVTRAVMLCKNPDFQRWMHFRGYTMDMTEEDTVQAMHSLLGLQSRGELAKDKAAQEKLAGLVADFYEEVPR